MPSFGRKPNSNAEKNSNAGSDDDDEGSSSQQSGAPAAGVKSKVGKMLRSMSFERRRNKPGGDTAPSKRDVSPFDRGEGH